MLRRMRSAIGMGICFEGGGVVVNFTLFYHSLNLMEFIDMSF
jgi:hypothetical protein